MLHHFLSFSCGTPNLPTTYEDRKANIGTHVNLENGVWKVNGRTVYDSEKHNHTDVTIQQAFELSSNVGMAKLAINYYAKNPMQYIYHLKRLRLNEFSGIDLVGETHPVIKSPKSKTWSATSLPWMAFGYEVLVSPLQTLMLYNAVANNGKMMRPYLVEEIRKGGVVLTANQPQVVEEKICSEGTLRQLRTCLEGVMVNGTGKALQTPYYKIAGKTGTALVANGNRGYGDHIYQASFAGYFPSEQPVYSCIVVIKNKAHALKYYGGAVAGPVFREISDKLFALQAQNIPVSTAGIPKNDSAAFFYTGRVKDVRKVYTELKVPFSDSALGSRWTNVSLAADFSPVLQKKEVIVSVMPDVKGMGLKDALFLLEEMDLKVLVKGAGKVMVQSVDAGKPIDKNQSIVLSLN